MVQGLLVQWVLMLLLQTGTHLPQREHGVTCISCQCLGIGRDMRSAFESIRERHKEGSGVEACDWCRVGAMGNSGNHRLGAFGS